MKSNVGSFDAAARFVVGCGLLIVANHTRGSVAIAAAVLFACSFFRFCPLWRALGINTARTEKNYRFPKWPDDEN